MNISLTFQNNNEWRSQMSIIPYRTPRTTTTMTKIIIEDKKTKQGFFNCWEGNKTIRHMSVCLCVCNANDCLRKN